MKKSLIILSMLLPAMLAMPAKAHQNQAPESPSGASVYTDTDEDDDEDEPPYIEPAFTVHFDIDNAEAVHIAANDKPISHTAGLNTITVDPGDGYIMVYVNDGFAFTRFYDETQKSDYLQYDYQTMPVTVRKMVATGEAEAMIVDGDTFTVRTTDMNGFDQFTLTVNVDVAAKAELRIGTAIDMSSSANRTIELKDGENTVTYSSIDKYLHLSGSSWFEPLQSVTMNGSNVPGDGQMNAVYTVQLKGERTQGAVINVTTAPEQEEDKFSFTAVFDDVDAIKYVTKMPGEKNMTFTEGENTYTFNPGNYYEIWTYRPARECTFNGEDVDYVAEMGYYKFYPLDGGVLRVLFNEPGPEPIKFTLDIDDVDMVESFTNDNTDEEITLVKGLNTILLDPDDEEPCYCLYPVNRTAAETFTLDGKKVTFRRSQYYLFCPDDGSEVIVRFHPEEDTSVADIQAEQAAGPVYNLQGMLVLRAATGADLRQLPSGIYITSGRKIAIP